MKPKRLKPWLAMSGNLTRFVLFVPLAFFWSWYAYVRTFTEFNLIMVKYSGRRKGKKEMLTANKNPQVPEAVL